MQTAACIAGLLTSACVWYLSTDVPHQHDCHALPSVVSGCATCPVTAVWLLIFRSALVSKPNELGLKCTTVHMYIRPQNVSSVSLKSGMYLKVDEWCTTVCSMTRSKVTSPWKLEIFPFSKAISCTIYNGNWKLTTDSWSRAQYLNLIGPDLLYLSYFLCHGTLNLAETSVVKSRPSVPYGSDLYSIDR